MQGEVQVPCVSVCVCVCVCVCGYSHKLQGLYVSMYVCIYLFKCLFYF